MTRLLTDIRSDVETGTSLSSAFRKHPLYFDALYCNLVEAGEAGGILETLLDRLAIYQEKTIAIKNKIKSALIYPIAVHRGRVRRAGGDHDLRDPGVQGRVQVVRRRPAGADAGRDRDVEVLRQLLVADLRRASAAASTSSCSRGSAPRRCRCSWTGCCCACRSSATSSTSRRSRAGRARCRRCSRPACRWSRRSTRSAAPRATAVFAEATEQIQRDVSTGSALTTVDADHRRLPDHGAADVRRSARNRARSTTCSARPPSSTRRRSTRRSRACPA